MKTAGIITLIALIIFMLSMYIGVILLVREHNKKMKSGHKNKSQNKTLGENNKDKRKMWR